MCLIFHEMHSKFDEICQMIVILLGMQNERGHPNWASGREWSHTGPVARVRTDGPAGKSEFVLWEPTVTQSLGTELTDPELEFSLI